VFLVNDTSEWWSLEQRSAVYIVQRRQKPEGLREEATRRRLKEQLEDVIARHEQIAEGIERASEPGADAAAARGETARPFSADNQARSIGMSSTRMTSCRNCPMI
jgi:hypothetical protein